MTSRDTWVSRRPVLPRSVGRCSPLGRWYVTVCSRSTCNEPILVLSFRSLHLTTFQCTHHDLGIAHDDTPGGTCIYSSKRTQASLIRLKCSDVQPQLSCLWLGDFGCQYLGPIYHQCVDMLLVHSVAIVILSLQTQVPLNAQNAVYLMRAQYPPTILAVVVA